MKRDAPELPPGFSWGAAAMGAERAPDGGAGIPGETEIEVDGTLFRRGGKVVLRPGEAGNPHDRLLHGHVATIERIYLDYEDRVYLAVVIDDDPGADLLRETGRFLFFFPQEVETL
jgi:hypothetical protein